MQFHTQSDRMLDITAKVMFGTYTRKEESVNELHEFVRTHIRMVSDGMKPICNCATNTEGFHELESLLLYKQSGSSIPQATNQLVWTVTK